MYKKTAPETIQAMFASIAQNYDKANTTFSFGLHKIWNMQLIQSLKGYKRLLDLCAGTGEIAFGFLKKNQESEAILLDFCPEMLAIAQKKGSPFALRFEILQADAQYIPLSEASVDAISIAYGIRNVADPVKCFVDAKRVLMPSGLFAILELTRPTSWSLRKAHRLYTSLILPVLGKMAAKNIEAYKYLAESVENFVTPEHIEKNLKESGFRQVHIQPLTGGVATLFLAHL